MDPKKEGNGCPKGEMAGSDQLVLGLRGTALTSLLAIDDDEAGVRSRVGVLPLLRLSKMNSPGKGADSSIRVDNARAIARLATGVKATVDDTARRRASQVLGVRRLKASRPGTGDANTGAVALVDVSATG